MILTDQKMNLLKVNRTFNFVPLRLNFRYNLILFIDDSYQVEKTYEE